MLSDLILEHKGKATGHRVMDVDINQKRETTVIANGKVREVDVSLIITYWNRPRFNAGGTIKETTPYYYGEGKGMISTKQDSNGIATVIEYGVGRALGNITIWRGSAFYTTQSSSSTSKLALLNNLVGVFETEVHNVSGDVSQKVWE